MKEKLEQLFYFGLGSALIAKEKIEQAGASTKGLREESDRKAREFFDQVVAKGTIHKNTASRKKSRLAKRLAKLA